jgi:hypothetical protein
MATDVKVGELVPRGKGELEQRPSFMDVGDRTGKEDIGPEDIRLPRLAIAQGLSGQLSPDDSTYIEGLRLYDMFNDLTGDVYARGPITFIPIKRSVKRIVFDPDNRGQILDMDVQPEDPRNEWTRGPNGERIAPAVTKYVEFVIFMLKDGGGTEPIVLSIKCTNKFQTRAAEKLTSLIMNRNAAFYGGVYSVASKSEKNDNGQFGVYVFHALGFVQDPNLYNAAKKFRESITGRTIIVNREPGSEDEFDTTDM